MQHQSHTGKVGEALEKRLIGAGLFGKMDDTHFLQLVQQSLFFKSGGHNVDYLHFFDHWLTSCSFFLAILPRTTAEVCWSPR